MAAFGLRALAALPKPRLRAAALALAALGVAAVAVQMVRVHPYQNEYFNFLVDKSGLADRWQMAYWGVSHKEALERMLKLHPQGRVSVNSRDYDLYTPSRNLHLIPLEDRRRTSINRYAPDFYIDRTAENPAWTREVYGAPIVSLVDNRDAARAAYRRAYAAARQRQPDFRAHFDVYAAGGLLIYTKEPCAEADTLGTFTVSARPVHPDAVSDYMRDDGFADKKFRFWDYGKILGDACVMALRTPAYPLESLNVAYHPANKERDAWGADIPMNDHLAAYGAAQDSEPLVRTSGFDIYRDGDTLAFVKEDCGEDDTRGRFLLSIFPVDRSDLSKRPRDAGLEHEPLNFDFAEYGAIFDGKCAIIRDLPDYPISHIETGQWMKGEDGLWSARIILDGFHERYRRALSALPGEPAIRSDFDVYLQDGALIYAKSPCAEGDTRGRFALSVYPADSSDLPKRARDAGLEHEPLNFDFAEYGAIFDGRCAIIRRLPSYPIGSIETGQWIPGEGELWRGRISVGD